MNALKHALKSFIRPLYRRLPTSWQTRIRRIRVAYRRVVPLPDPRFAPFPKSLQPLLSYLQENDRLLLALLKSTHMASSRPSAPPSFQAVAMGNHRLLASHPVASFLYLDDRDAAVVPHIILDRYEKGIQRVLRQLVEPGFVVLEARARHGFHTLTLAHLVSPTGKVFAFEPDDAQRQALRDNIAAHDLGAIVAVHEPSGEEQAFPGSKVLRWLERRPDLIRLDVADEVDSAFADLSDLLFGAPDLRVVLTLPGGCSAAAPLQRLAESGMRFWQIGSEGSLEDRMLGQVLRATQQGRIHLVAARSLS